MHARPGSSPHPNPQDTASLESPSLQRPARPRILAGSLRTIPIASRTVLLATLVCACNSSEQSADAVPPPTDLNPTDASADQATRPADAALTDALADAPEEPQGPENVFDSTFSYVTASGTQRDIKYRVWYPMTLTDLAPVIITSPGIGVVDGHLWFAHLGAEYSAHGYVSIHLDHIPSATSAQFRKDTPADVSTLLDRLEKGEIALPPAFKGKLDLSRIAHVGHSWGAYTAHALGGATFDHGTFTDKRIKVIIPMSPQGWGTGGSFDDEHDITKPSTRNSWMDVRIPSYVFVGELEKDNQVAPYKLMGTDWRLFPFARYPQEGDKYLSVIPAQDHVQIAGFATDDVVAYLAENSRVFLDAYLKGDPSRVCEIGRIKVIEGTDNRRKFDAVSGLPSKCP